MNATEIVNTILEKERIKPGSFAKAIGVNPTQIYDLQNGKTKKISDAMANKIIKSYSHYNRIWLLTGEGEMLINESTNENNKSNMKTESSNTSGYYTTYLLPLSAMGGSLTGFAADGVMLQNCEAIVSPIANVDFAITVYGDSMSPEYPSGSRILINKINPNIFIEWGKTFVLDTPNGVIVKEVWMSSKEGCIRCHSINPDPKYTDFDVPMDEIYGMYRVLMCLSAK